MTESPAGVPWRRLSVRTIYLSVVRAVISLIPAYLGIVVLGEDGPVWPLVAGSAFGLLGALGDLRRWQTTRYRITPEVVEMRTGWLARKHRTVNRDRIRSVDSTAKGLSRLLGLKTVHIGSGESGSSFQLNALDEASAARLQQELMSGAKAYGEVGGDAEETAPEPETVIARLRPEWIPLNIVSVWAPFAVAAPIFGGYWFLRQFGVDLLGFAEGLLDWRALGLVWTIVLLVLVSYPIGIAMNAAAFLLENWKFELVRAGTPPATALVSRKGLITTRTVHRDDERLRGIAFAEPLVWRWLRLAETKVIASGLQHNSGAATSVVLPRIRLAEARDLAEQILPDGGRPLETPLVPHPRAALTRRLFQAVLWPVLAAGILLVLDSLDIVPDGWWPLPLILLLVTLPLAVGAYRGLGHALTDRYLVIRSGVVSLRTVALQRRAVIGWTFEQSIFQRRRDLITVRVATAAGDRSYEAPDLGVGQALAFIDGITPELAAQFLEPVAPARQKSTVGS
jgi:putative membrane protein